MLRNEDLQKIQDKATQGIGWFGVDKVEMNSATAKELVKMARRYLWLRDSNAASGWLDSHPNAIDRGEIFEAALDESMEQDS